MSPSAEEGSRLRRNVVSFLAFTISPLQMSFLSRALGADGFGRWWWTFVVIELMTLLGMLGADLYVRRELPGRVADRDAMHRCVGSSLAVTGALGLALCALQAFSARWVADTQGDPALAVYLAMLSLQPVLTNLGGILAAALQSVDAYSGIALVRGLLAPLSQVAFLAIAWRLRLDVPRVLAGMIALLAVSTAASFVLYLRHFDLRATLANTFRPRELGAVLGFGLPLLVPNALWTVGGKIDLYLLRPSVGPATLGVYSGCLQLASALPNTRTVFDPVVQQQIAALQHARTALGLSLQRLSRLSGLALLPFFVGLVSVGEPVLGFLLGRPAPESALPLAILSVGQFLGSMAVASWMAPMLLARRSLSLLAFATLVGKTLLLLWLVPRTGAVGAALATAIGTAVSQQGMAWLASHSLQVRVYTRRLFLVVLVTFAGGMAAALLHTLQPPGLLGFVQSALLAGACALAALLFLLEANERRWLVDQVRARV